MIYRLALLICPLVLVAQQTSRDNSAIAGQVANAITREPVNKALVYVRRTDLPVNVNTQILTLTATADATGHFAIADLPPGKYRISAERNGFVQAEYGARAPGRPGQPLELERGKPVTDLLILMTPHGVVSGRISDEEGEPVPGVDVQLSALRYAGGRRQLLRTGGAMTNDLGEYRVYGLPPGKYFLGASYRPNVLVTIATQRQPEDEYVTTYYPRTTDPAAAAPITLTPGAQLRGIDLRLAKVRTVPVRGRVVMEDLPPQATISVMLAPRGVEGLGSSAVRAASVNKDGSFDIRSVPPGAYTLTATLGRGPQFSSGRMAVQVGPGGVEGLTLPVRGGLAIDGRVTVDGDAGELPPRLQIALQPFDFGYMVFGSSPAVRVGEQGAFRLEGISADAYRVVVASLPEGWYVKAIRCGSADVLAGGLDMNGGGRGAPLEIVISPQAGQVTGAVLDPATGKPAIGAVVALVPVEKDRLGLPAFTRSTAGDRTGRFTFSSLTPGEYRVYAWEDVESGAWMDPEFLKPLEARGEKVTVHEAATETVQVRMIPADAR